MCVYVLTAFESVPDDTSTRQIISVHFFRFFAERGKDYIERREHLAHFPYVCPEIHKIPFFP